MMDRDGEDKGFARVHYDKKTGRILAGTLVARHAGEMISELTLAIVGVQRWKDWILRLRSEGLPLRDKLSGE